MCSNNIEHNMTECTKQQHTTKKEIKKYKIKHKTNCQLGLLSILLSQGTLHAVQATVS